ncbi:MAG: hypothetical protein HJHJAOHD_02647 [Flavobacteriales bacterium]|nr:hypothetical protein [Flavobacteriales bacterium]
MEIFNRQKAIEICNLGVNEKRKGNYKKALDYYTEAKSFDPTFHHIYNNSAKVLIGIGDFDLAFKNLLTYAHLNLILPYYNLSQYDMLLPYYQWNYAISHTLDLKPNLVKSVCDEAEQCKYIAVELNLCANSGICYALTNKSVIEDNEIDINIFKQYQNILLGIPSTGEDVRSSVFAPMINLLGFAYLVRNILGSDYSTLEVSQIYLDDTFIPRNL